MDDPIFQALNEQAAPEDSAPEAAPEVVADPAPPPPAVEAVEPEPEAKPKAQAEPNPAPESLSQGQGQKPRKEPRQTATDPKPDPLPADPAPADSKTPAETGGTDSPPSPSQTQLDAADASLKQPLKPRPGTKADGASAYGDLPPVEALRKEALDISAFLNNSRGAIVEQQQASNVRRADAETARQDLKSDGFFTADRIARFLELNPQMNVTMEQLVAAGYDAKNPFRSSASDGFESLYSIRSRFPYESPAKTRGSLLVQSVYDAMRNREIAQVRSLEQKASAHEQRVRGIGRQVERNERRLAEIRQVTAGFVGPEQPQPLNEAQERIESAVTDVDQVLRLVLQLPPSSNTNYAAQSRREAAVQTAREMLVSQGLKKYANLVEATPEEIRAILAGLDNLNKAYSFDKPSRQPSATDFRRAQLPLESVLSAD